ncbi:MAG: hypothetical protein HY365_00315 [Candidatus Aenigmarchaeota archaeon]|nr:hypothetical protein [Candidatus Aenigmarchaeota archaeon]
MSHGKIAVIADAEKQKELAPLVRKGGEIFGSALFASYGKIRIETGRGIRVVCDGEELTEYDAVFPFPSSMGDAALPVIAALDSSLAYVPYGMDAYFSFQRKALGMKILSHSGFSCLDVHHALTEDALTDAIPTLPFPIRIRIGDKSSIIEDKKHLSALMKLRKSGQAISVEETVPDKLIGCFVANNEALASVDIINGKTRAANVGSVMQDMAVSAVRSLGSSYGFVTFADDKIVSFTLSPPIASIEAASGKDVCTPLLNVAKNARPARKLGILRAIMGAIGVRK